VAHGGSFAGNIVGVAAADATLEILETEPIIETINQRGRRLMEGFDEILGDAGIPHSITGLPPMFGLILGVDEEPADFRDYCAGDDRLYERVSMALIERGVMPEKDGSEPWFLCYSHTEELIDETLTVFEQVVKEVKRSAGRRLG